ncbi:hypothetical protein DFH09DRAFT_1097908 [Mycena vulgaris]|nr:hypothetical protein DFH09DRAFT_1097908 [Mycena vulgaris]
MVRLDPVTHRLPRPDTRPTVRAEADTPLHRGRVITSVELKKARHTIYDASTRLAFYHRIAEPDAVRVPSTTVPITQNGRTIRFAADLPSKIAIPLKRQFDGQDVFDGRQWKASKGTKKWEPKPTPPGVRRSGRNKARVTRKNFARVGGKWRQTSREVAAVGVSVTYIDANLAAVPFRVASIGVNVGVKASLSPCPMHATLKHR